MPHRIDALKYYEQFMSMWLVMEVLAMEQNSPPLTALNICPFFASKCILSVIPFIDLRTCPQKWKHAVNDNVRKVFENHCSSLGHVVLKISLLQVGYGEINRKDPLQFQNYLTRSTLGIYTNVLIYTVKLARAKLPAKAAGKLIRR